MDPTTQQHRVDIVYTLITITLYHFVGDTNVIKERTQELIMNLKYPSLTHFRWYKDIFLSLLFQRDDSILDF